MNFYISYITTNTQTSFLNPMLHSAIKSSIKENENRMANNLFRLTVEMSMMMNILAEGLEIKSEDLRVLCNRCTKNIKESKGRIEFEDVLKGER